MSRLGHRFFFLFGDKEKFSFFRTLGPRSSWFELFARFLLLQRTRIVQPSFPSLGIDQKSPLFLSGRYIVPPEKLGNLGFSFQRKRCPINTAPPGGDVDLPPFVWNRSGKTTPFPLLDAMIEILFSPCVMWSNSKNRKSPPPPPPPLLSQSRNNRSYSFLFNFSLHCSDSVCPPPFYPIEIWKTEGLSYILFDLGVRSTSGPLSVALWFEVLVQ